MFFCGFEKFLEKRLNWIKLSKKKNGTVIRQEPLLKSCLWVSLHLLVDPHSSFSEHFFFNVSQAIFNVLLFSSFIETHSMINWPPVGSYGCHVTLAKTQQENKMKKKQTPKQNKEVGRIVSVTGNSNPQTHRRRCSLRGGHVPRADSASGL